MMSGIVGSNTHRSLSIKEFRAFSMVDKFAPLIFINANDSQGARLFSLIHEMVHILLGVNNLYNDRYGSADRISPVEKLCNSVTADILVSDDSFESKWREMTRLEVYDRIKMMSQTLKCGIVVIARKALDRRYISKELYRSIVEDAVNKYNDSRSNSSGGDYYATVTTRFDNRFILALDNSIREGKTPYTEAYRLTNTNRKTFSGLVDKVRGIG